MKSKTALPEKGDVFLDQVQKNLGLFLEQVQKQEGSWKEPPISSRSPFPLGDVCQKVHAGLDQRMETISARLRLLDQDLAKIEGDAQEMQQEARRLRDAREWPSRNRQADETLPPIPFHERPLSFSRAIR